MQYKGKANVIIFATVRAGINGSYRDIDRYTYVYGYGFTFP